MDWMRLSLLLLGIVLIAGIWVTHRMRTRSRGRDEGEDLRDWDEDAVHIRAGGSDAADSGPRVTGGRREPHLGVTSPGPDVDPELEDPFDPAPPTAGSRDEPRDPVSDIYGVLEDEEPRRPAADADDDVAFTTDYHGDMRAPREDDAFPEPEIRPEPEETPRTAMGHRGGGSGLMGRLRGAVRRGVDTFGTMRGKKASDDVYLSPDHELDPDLIEGPEPPDPESLGEYVSEPRKAGPNPRAASASMQEKILLLHVVAPRNKPFTGVALGAALERAGLQPGAMDIYHYHEPASDSRQPLFSVANMVAPGTLRDEDLADMMTPGVTLFTQVHYSAHPQRAFEALLENAHALARDLGGTILDAQQSTATNQTLSHMREELNHWLLRNRPDILRRGGAR